MKCLLKNFPLLPPGLFPLLLLLPHLYFLPLFLAAFPPGEKRASHEAKMGKSQQTGEGEGGGRKETSLLLGIRIPRA